MPTCARQAFSPMLHHDKNESSANNTKGKLFIVHKSWPLDNKHCDFQFSFADCGFYSPVLCFTMPFLSEVAGYSHVARSALFCFLFCSGVRESMSHGSVSWHWQCYGSILRLAITFLFFLRARSVGIEQHKECHQPKQSTHEGTLWGVFRVPMQP